MAMIVVYLFIFLQVIMAEHEKQMYGINEASWGETELENAL